MATVTSPPTSGLVTVANGSESTSVTICYDPNFYQRVAQIAVAVAYAVCREQDGGATVTGHESRASRALQFFAVSGQVAAQIDLAMLVACDNATNESSTSQQIADRLTALWDTYSGN